MNKHVIKKKNIVLFALLGIISLLLIINLKNNGILQFNNQKKSLAKQVAEIEATYDQQAGKDAIVSSLKITGKETGKDAFDDDDDPGNDSGPENNIIRTLDMLSYTIDVGMELKEGISEYISVATIKIEATLPSDCADRVRWDLTSMPWADKNSFVTDDGLKFIGYYTMGENQVSIPGDQKLLLVAKVLFAENGFKFSPEFSASLLGNEDNEVNTLKDNDEITVSATDKYDIALNCKSNNNTVLVDEKEGKVFAYAFAFILKGDNEEKGLRGIERPINDIKFDIKYRLSRQDNDGYANITSSVRLYNYKYNIYNTQVLGDQKNSIEDISYMGWDSWGWCPFSKVEDEESGFKTIPRKAVYKNGIIKMEDKGIDEDGTGVVNVTISNWDISETFPDLVDQEIHTDENYHSFPENYGYVSTGMFYFIVDVNEETTKDNNKVDLNIKAENVNIDRLSDEQFLEEVDLSNNTVYQRFYNEANGSYDKRIVFEKDDWGQMSSRWNAGDASQYVNKDILITNVIEAGAQNGVKDWIYGLDCLTKFDDEALQVKRTSDGKEYLVRDGQMGTERPDLEYNVLYAAKENGTGWESDEEMIETTMDNLVYYNTIEDLEKTGKTCIAVLVESQSGIIKSGKSVDIGVPFKIKSDATINSVVQALNDVRIYNKDNIPNRETQTHLSNTDKNTYGTIKWSEENINYVKSEYDENGNIKEKTHDPGIGAGDSLRILAGDLRVYVTPYQNDIKKDIFDMGNGENEVDYKLYISLGRPDSTYEHIEGVNVKVKATLPKGLIYKKGSSNRDEPEIIENADGTTTLIWYEKDCSTNVDIESIKFTAYISETTKNNTVYEVSAIISEEPGEDRNIQSRR